MAVSLHRYDGFGKAKHYAKGGPPVCFVEFKVRGDWWLWSGVYINTKLSVLYLSNGYYMG